LFLKRSPYAETRKAEAMNLGKAVKKVAVDDYSKKYRQFLLEEHDFNINPTNIQHG
jgi:hypothetical protein